MKVIVISVTKKNSLHFFSEQFNMSEITAVSLSSDSQSFAVTLRHSFQVYSVEPVKRKFLKDFVNYTITHISTINDGTIVAFSVRALTSENAATNKVFIWNNQYGEGSVQLSFKEEVLNIILSPHFLLIVLHNSIVIYDIDQKTTQLEEVTAENRRGCGDLMCVPDQPLLAICGLQPGSVQVSELNANFNSSHYNHSNFNNPVVFQAHQHPVSLLKFSPDGSLIATASEKGTLIRIFDSVTGALLSTFRRGAIPSNILALAFSPSNSQLVAISDNGTAHLFPADERNGNPADPPRAVAKAKIEKGVFVQAVYAREDLLYIISSSGHLHQLRSSTTSIETSNKFFVLAH
ncbi:hypothetical protein TRFO_38849 [Tritrichomonas foetus]|uniref:WD repeat domain phosphoinositide-interacting protein 3 n=1 Tax=Tritrichomonas foetus TaxID=1144522 RepID=A0A1J4J8E2_9EUKA|nr:hypothetical protein TRFO_38849 [Tritrichomonas foetus]|eukprot:OHS94961.1 hypothetical protein TRFO_38849 [Tritrichomonas foetus]